MSYRKGRVRQLAAGVEQALRALEQSPDAAAVDAWLDPAQAAAQLGEGGALLMRAAPLLQPGQGDYAALPQDALWLAVPERAAALSWCSLRDAAVEHGEVAGVVVEHSTTSCCDAAKCKDDKATGRLLVELDGDRTLVLAEHMASDGGALLERLLAVARPLGERLGVAVSGDDGRELPEPEPPEPPLSAKQLSRWALRREEGLFVLREYASLGPREAAAREFAVVAALTIGGGVAWYGASLAWADQNYERLAIAGAIAVVLTLATYAMLHIARFSAKYRERSEPLLYMARDRFVMAPWVSRAGAVDEKPEGRFGAAISIGEIEALNVDAQRDGFSIVLETRDHGPFCIGTLESEAQAQAWRRALARLAEAAAHRRVAKEKSRAPSMAAALLSGATLMVVVATLGACGPTPVTPEVETSPTTPAIAQPSAALASASAMPTPAGATQAGATKPKLRLIEDDVDGALSKARAAGKAVFVEVWAPWCHTCLSMKSFVLPDPAIVALQQRVVFAAVDSDRPANSAFMARYAVNVWPTLYVLDAKDGKVLGLWQGAASIEELRNFITTSVDARDAALDPKGPLSALQQAKQAHGASKYAEAARFYRQAFERGGESWPRRSEAIHGLVFSEYKMAHWQLCSKLGAEHVASIEGAAIPTDFSWVVLSCAKRIKDKALANKARAGCLARMRRHTDQPPAASSVDDRADALSLLSDMLAGAGDKAGARAALEKQIALLEQAAAAAPSPEAAATFDYQRMNTYLSLGRGDQAVAMLEKRRKQMPDSYEPPARLAQALVALKRFAAAREAVDDALDKSYGARKLRYFALAATIHGKLRDRAMQKESLQGLIKTYEGLDAALQKDPRNKDQADEARAALRKLK